MEDSKSCSEKIGYKIIDIFEKKVSCSKEEIISEIKSDRKGYELFSDETIEEVVENTLYLLVKYLFIKFDSSDGLYHKSTTMFRR